MQTVADTVIDSGLAPEQIELEITESVPFQNNDEGLAILTALKSPGASIVPALAANRSNAA